MKLIQIILPENGMKYKFNVVPLLIAIINIQLLCVKVLEGPSKPSEIAHKFNRSYCLFTSLAVPHPWDICFTWFTTFWW